MRSMWPSGSPEPHRGARRRHGPARACPSSRISLRRDARASKIRATTIVATRTFRNSRRSFEATPPFRLPPRNPKKTSRTHRSDVFGFEAEQIPSKAIATQDRAPAAGGGPVLRKPTAHLPSLFPFFEGWWPGRMPLRGTALYSACGLTEPRLTMVRNMHVGAGLGLSVTIAFAAIRQVQKSRYKKTGRSDPAGFLFRI
jgi:hypothetical protein